MSSGCANAPGCIGNCKGCSSPKDVFGRGGMIGTATPFADGDNLFQRICFSPPFTTGCNESVNCIDTIATTAGCVYDAECPDSHRCKDAMCVPKMKRSLGEPSTGSYGSYARGNSHSIPFINPQELDSFSNNDPGFLRYLPAPYNKSMAMGQRFLETTCPSTPGILYTKASPSSEPGLVCPLFPGYVKERNCRNCIKTLESCNMLSGFLSKEQYDQCKKREECFQYDIALKSGIIHPIGYKITPECVAVARQAIEQCGSECYPESSPLF